MKTLAVLFVLIWPTILCAQSLYQGPATGSVASGAVISTSFVENMTGKEHLLPARAPRNTRVADVYPTGEYVEALAAEGTNYVPDRTYGTAADTIPLLWRSFPGIPQTNSIPPDPYCAVGPTHFMAVVNSSFRIYDRNGNIVTTISADTWFNNVFASPGAFDPKVSYDHFGKRWIMVWLQQRDFDQTGHYLVSVSDDSIPTGTWYNWALPSTTNGNTPDGTWSDYQGVGFDSVALYITGRQFTFSGGTLLYNKIRIIEKSQLYANTAGSVQWQDLWDIRNPVSLGSRPDGIRPSIFYTHSNEHYFMVVPFTSAYTTNTYVVLYKLSNPVTSPVLTGASVSTVSYTNPPSAFANQLGGSTILLESGGVRFRHEPSFRNGYLWATHAVINPTNTAYQAINYLKINVSTNAAVEDYTFGAEGYWYFYPAITPDKHGNLVISYSRSGDTEYPGAFFNSRLNSDPPGTFYGSVPLMEGQANYVKDFGSGRNRWGDYNGSWLDPVDEETVWLLTEYAESPANTWGTRVGAVRVTPFDGARIHTHALNLDFGDIEVTYADTLEFTLTNFGADNLEVTGVSMASADLGLVSPVAFPINLAYRDSVHFALAFAPSVSGDLIDTLKILSNDAMLPAYPILIRGHGFVIHPVTSSTMYGAGTASGGSLLTLNPVTGQGTPIGPTGFSEIRGLGIRPSNNELYGSIALGTEMGLVRINADGGDGYLSTYVPIGGRAISFRDDSTVYCSLTNGKLYLVNVNSGDTASIGNTGITNLYGLAVNPMNGDLWGSSFSGSIYRINSSNGSATLVGPSGFSSMRDIEFDGNAALFAVASTNAQ